MTRLRLPSNQEQEAGATGASDTAKAVEDQGFEQELPEPPQAADQLKAVSALVNSELALLEGNGLSARGGTGINGDDRDGRQVGPNGPGGPVIPAGQRWQIHYAAADIQEYAAILDAFRVELGVMGGGEPTISYARNLAQAHAQTRPGNGKEERRLHFVFTQGELKEADRALALQAGITVEGRIVAQFYPDDVKQQLELLERGAIGARPLASVRRTVFGIRKATSGWEFFVERVEPAQATVGFTPL
ncbi:MAG: hypothetical protein ACKVP0_22005 [Pirellulaceae bacterium]